MELNQIQFKSFCNLNHGNMLNFTYTSEAYNTHFKMIQIDQTMSHVTWLSLNSNWSLNLQFNLQYTPFKLNCFTHQSIYIKFQPSIMCLCIVFTLLPCLLFVE